MNFGYVFGVLLDWEYLILLLRNKLAAILQLGMVDVAPKAKHIWDLVESGIHKRFSWIRIRIMRLVIRSWNESGVEKLFDCH